MNGHAKTSQGRASNAGRRGNAEKAVSLVREAISHLESSGPAFAHVIDPALHLALAIARRLDTLPEASQ